MMRLVMVETSGFHGLIWPENEDLSRGRHFAGEVAGVTVSRKSRLPESSGFDRPRAVDPHIASDETKKARANRAFGEERNRFIVQQR